MKGKVIVGSALLAVVGLVLAGTGVVRPVGIAMLVLALIGLFASGVGSTTFGAGGDG